MTEIWKDIEGFEGFYQVSNTGLVRGVDRHTSRRFITGRILSPSTDGKGYMFVYLSKYDKPTMKKVHRLVAFAFITNEKPDLYNAINHKDGNKKNNHFSNLEWCNNSKNSQHAWDTGLITKRFGKDHWCSKAVVQLDLDGNPIKTYESITAAGKATGIVVTNIASSILGRKGRIKAGGFKWRYAS